MLMLVQLCSEASHTLSIAIGRRRPSPGSAPRAHRACSVLYAAAPAAPGAPPARGPGTCGKRGIVSLHAFSVRSAQAPVAPSVPRRQPRLCDNPSLCSSDSSASVRKPNGGKTPRACMYRDCMLRTGRGPVSPAPASPAGPRRRSQAAAHAAWSLLSCCCLPDLPPCREPQAHRAQGHLPLPQFCYETRTHPLTHLLSRLAQLGAHVQAQVQGPFEPLRRQVQGRAEACQARRRGHGTRPGAPAGTRALKGSGLLQSPSPPRCQLGGPPWCSHRRPLP